MLNGMDEGYRRLLHLALAHRPTVVGAGGRVRSIAAAFIFPTLPTELATQTDEGQVQVNVELALGTRIEVTDPVLQRIEASINQLVPEATDVIVNAGGRRLRTSGGGEPEPRQPPAAARCRRTSGPDRASRSRMELRRQLSGIPGVIVRANASGGNNQMNRFLSGGNFGGGGRLSLEIRGESLDDSQAAGAGREGPARHGARRRRRAARPRRGSAGAGRAASTARRRRCSA